MLHLISTQRSVIKSAARRADKVSPYVCALRRSAAPLPQARLRQISTKLRSLRYLFFFSSPRDQWDVFPLSASFGADQQQVPGGLLGDIRGLRVTHSLPVSVRLSSALVSLGKKAARVADKQHLIPTDLDVRVSFPICVSAHNESPCERCQED